jgi:7-cyano-7-deazaguanine reductase
MKTFKEVDPGILQAMESPTEKAYELRHFSHELTFFGKQGQADFAKILIIFYPAKTTIELKSLKEYLGQYRDVVISYERLINVIYDHIYEKFKPVRLRIELWFRPRGGLSTHAVVDSDWEVRGGKGQFWHNEPDRSGFVSNQKSDIFEAE